MSPNVSCGSVKSHMAEITNEFSWSITRGKQFHECRRMYWFGYYGHWGGWYEDSPDRTRLIYLLKKMSNLDMWSGAIVHQVIEEACRMTRDRQAVDATWGESRAVALLKSGWKESKSGRWKQDPKRRLNLFEHYYQIDVPKDRTDRIKQKVLKALQTFFSSDEWKLLQHIPAEDWLRMEEMDSFSVDGIKLFANPDLSIRHNARVRLYDWKTGKPRAEDEDQLVGYALYALHKGWAKDAKEIDLIAAYLPTNDWKTVPVDHARIQTLIAGIKAQVADMQSLLSNPDRNVAEEASFPLTDDVRTCRRCSYRAVCNGAQRPGAVF